MKERKEERKKEIAEATRKKAKKSPCLAKCTIESAEVLKTFIILFIKNKYYHIYHSSLD